MNYAEYNEKIALLNEISSQLEYMYIENGGEVTEETMELTARIDELADLLSKDGMDFLGGWLKAKEDKKKALKAEKDYISRQIEANDSSIEFVKNQVTYLMDRIGMVKTEKSTRGYQFTRTESKTTAVDKTLIDVLYKEKAQEALAAANIPSYIKVSLTGSVDAFNLAVENHAVPEGDEEIFATYTKQTVRFTKPKASKE